MTMRVDLSNVRFFDRNSTGPGGVAQYTGGDRIYVYLQDAIVFPGEMIDKIGRPKNMKFGELDTLYIFVPCEEQDGQTYKVQYGKHIAAGVGRVSNKSFLKSNNIGVPGYVVSYPALVVDGVVIIEKRATPNIVKKLSNSNGKDKK